MSTLEIICGVLLLIACAVIILVVLIQNKKDQGMSSAISGTANDSYFGKNSKNTRDAKINKFTRTAAIIFFAATLAVNIAAVYAK